MYHINAIDSVSKFPRKLALFVYVVSLVLILSWRPNVDFGVTITPTYLILVFLFIILLRWPYFALYKFDYALLIFYGFALLTSFYAPNPAASIKFFFGIIFFWGVYLCFKLCINRIDLCTILNLFERLGKIYFLFAFLFYCAGFIAFGSWQEHQIYYGLMVERQIPRLVALCFDPNMAAMTFVPFIFFFLLCRKSYLWLLMGLILLLATFSRGAIVATVLGLFWLTIVRPSKSIISTAMIFLILIVASLVIAITLDILPLSYLEQRLEGFFSGSGRLDIWSNALTIFVDRPLVGWGGFSFRDINQIYFDDPRFAHNTFIEVLVETGVIGFIVFVSFIVLILARSIWLATDHRLLFLVPSTFACVVSMAFLSIYINQVLIFYLVLLNFGGGAKGFLWPR